MWNSKTIAVNETAGNNEETIRNEVDGTDGNDEMEISLYSNTEAQICSEDSGYTTTCFQSSTCVKSSSLTNAEELLELNDLQLDQFNMDNSKFPKDFNSLLTDTLVSTYDKKALKQKPNRLKLKRSSPYKHITSFGVSKAIDQVFEPLLEATCNEEIVKSALLRSSTDPNLIGDYSKSFCLPLVPGKHQDLKSINSTTLSLLLNGKYDDVVSAYKIIDCRYPYEFQGGHIKGAVNLYTQNFIVEHFFNSDILSNSGMDTEKHEIIIFHCEFSSSRAPNLHRFFRNYDRHLNEKKYPFLYYPELYLLDKGYKDFFNSCLDLCIPQQYVPMADSNYTTDLSYFKEQTKSFNNRINNMGIFKKLNFN